jgi:hypothetical protein
MPDRGIRIFSAQIMGANKIYYDVYNFLTYCHTKGYAIFRTLLSPKNQHKLLTLLYAGVIIIA